ncbi:endochitinase 4-like [Nymphaea colorata]|nr:endochitinase 4-like [Nymphaea colorata]
MKSYTPFVAVFLVVVALVLEVGFAQDTPRSIVTPSFFNSLLPPDGCEGKGFYNYDAFISAAESYGGFGTTGSPAVRKREMAAFLANVMHETGSFCFIKEQNPPSDYCDQNNRQYPCVPGKRYYGRGPLQLSWNYNYGAAGKAIGFDGLNHPGIVGHDAGISFKTAVWFWMLNSNCHQGITTGGGFGSTIKAINGGECNGGNPGAVRSRVNFYRRFCGQFGIAPGQNIDC